MVNRNSAPTADAQISHGMDPAARDTDQDYGTQCPPRHAHKISSGCPWPAVAFKSARSERLNGFDRRRVHSVARVEGYSFLLSPLATVWNLVHRTFCAWTVWFCRTGLESGVFAAPIARR